MIPDSKASQSIVSLFWKVSCQPQYSFGLRSMKMVTTLAGKQLQKDMAKRKLATMSSIREDREGDAGENIKYFFLMWFYTTEAKIVYIVVDKLNVVLVWCRKNPRIASWLSYCN